MVLRREMPPQHSDRGQGQGARGKEVEDDRKAAACSSRLDAIAGGVLGEPQGLGAVAEERPVALGGIEGRTQLECREMSHELGRCFAFLPGEGVDASEEVSVRQSDRGSEDVRFHDPVYHGLFFALAIALRRLRSETGRWSRPCAGDQSENAWRRRGLAQAALVEGTIRRNAFCASKPRSKTIGAEK